MNELKGKLKDPDRFRFHFRILKFIQYFEGSAARTLQFSLIFAFRCEFLKNGNDLSIYNSELFALGAPLSAAAASASTCVEM